MIIFGVDPGTAITGYGVINVQGNAVKWIDSGIVKTDSSHSLPERLCTIYECLFEKIKFYTPDRVCVEMAFYAKNVHTTLILGHTRGVIMLAARKSGAHVVEYSPREIKKAVAGNGNAAKDQVKYMVNMLLSIPKKHEYNDAYDALAIALCDFHNVGYQTVLKKSPEKKCYRTKKVTVYK
jgi:crossover junction endodeoxyribonuclease RuvC